MTRNHTTRPSQVRWPKGPVGLGLQDPILQQRTQPIQFLVSNRKTVLNQTNNQKQETRHADGYAHLTDCEAYKPETDR